MHAGSPASNEPSSGVVVTASASASTRLTTDAETEVGPAISPDGRQLLFTVFASETADGTQSGRALSSIVGIGPGTGTSRTIYTTHKGVSAGPRWMPSGQSFVYVSNQLGKNSIVRSLSNAPGAAVAVIVRGDLAEDLAYPDVSPDGSRVACQAKISGAWKVATAKVDGSEFTVIGDGTGPRFSPDGNHLLFARNVADHTQLFTVDAASGANLVQVTNSRYDSSWAGWSPDGRWIVFAATAGDRTDARGQPVWNVFAVRPDGTRLTAITDGACTSYMPDWGKDDYLYFASDCAGNFDIWRLQLVGELVATHSPR